MSLFSKCCPKKGDYVSIKNEAADMDTSLHDQNDISTDKKDGIMDLIILGPSECGKSTVIRHMNYMANKGYNPNDMPEIIANIRSNVMEGTINIIQGMDNLGIPFEISANRDRAIVFKELGKDAQLTGEQVNELRELLRDHGVHEALKRSNEFNFNYAFNYYVNIKRLRDNTESSNVIDGLARVFDPNFVPTLEDAIHMRRRTVGYTQNEFVFHGVKFRITDVGGELQARMRWGPLIRNAIMIIFVASLSDYNLVLREDGQTNRMEDAIALFELECARSDLKRKGMFLFLNKVDIFIRKIRHIPIANYFPDYHGANDAKSAVSFFKQKFMEVGGEKTRSHMLRVATTDATDKNSMEKVFLAVRDTVIQQVAKSSLL